jgi:hypothetical protein
VGLWNYIQQLARGGLTSVVTAHSLQGDNEGTIHTIAVSPHKSPMAIEACSRACLKASMIACLIACLRELRFEQSRVFHRKLLANVKL